MRFRQQPQHQQQVHISDQQCDPDRQRDAPLAQDSREGRSEDESQAKGHTDQTKGFGPVFWGADVSQHRTCGGCRATTEAIEKATAKQQQQRPEAAIGPGQFQGQAKHPKPNNGSCHTGGNHRAPAKAVTEGADEGGGDELGQGVTAGQQTQGGAAAGEARQQKRQQGEDQAFAHPVIEQGDENAKQGGGALQLRRSPVEPCRALGARLAKHQQLAGAAAALVPWLAALAAGSFR